MGTVNPSALTRGHHAALRAYVQGVPLPVIAERYLGLDPDEGGLEGRFIQREILKVRHALVQRAHQHGQPALAEALSQDVRHSNAGMDRAIAAIHALERLGTMRPALAHPVEWWFAPALSLRLRRAGLTTLGALTQHCNDRGRGWWRRVPRVGAQAAGAIVAWLRSHETDLGALLGAHVTGEPPALALPGSCAPVVIDAGALAVPPLEAMRLAGALDGSAGRNRAPAERCMLTARDDYEALLTWLSLWPAGSHTWRAYRKETERFLAWAIIERGKALSSLMTEDCIAYRDFLADPQPATRWCGPMVSRWLPGWRPFQAPLSPASQKYTLTVLRACCEFLMRQGYLYANPWDGVRERVRTAPHIQAEKALPADLWQRFRIWLDAAARDSEAAQVRVARAAILLLRDSGVRLGEACRADRAGLEPLPDCGAGGVWGELTIVGKRNKVRGVPLSHDAVEALRAHWRDRGEDFDRSPDGLLLAPLARPATARARAKEERGERGYGSSGLHHVIVRAAEAFAEDMAAEEGALVQRARGTRAHALRHSFGVHAADAGVPVDVLQAILGHASMATTTIYTQPGRKRRLREIGKLYRH